jgi:hypothetical protein
MSKAEESPVEKNYKVKERAEAAVVNHGSIEKAIRYLTAELKECEDLWSSYSSDCLGHAITCNRLLIDWLQRTQPTNPNS